MKESLTCKLLLLTKFQRQELGMNHVTLLNVQDVMEKKNCGLNLDLLTTLYSSCVKYPRLINKKTCFKHA